MKFGIIILVILGLVAAGSAAMLVGVIGVNKKQTQKEVSYVEAAKAKTDLPAMTVITSDKIEIEKIDKDSLPEGKALSAATVIGKVLRVPVVKGQVLTLNSFITDGTGAQLIASIPEGMRAVSVTLSSRAIPDEILLYPGSIVDLLVSFRLPSSAMGSALSTTMFTGLQVIAVEGDSVVTKQSVEGQAAAKPKRSAGQVTVTFMVDTKQAEALQLVVENGSVMLSVRNPLDKKAVDTEATVLSQGRMAGLASVLTPTVVSEVDQEKSLALIKEAITNKKGTADPNDPNNLTDTQVTQEKAPSFLSVLTQAILNRTAPQAGRNDVDTQKTNIEEHSSNKEPQLLSDKDYNNDQQNQTRQNPRWGVTVIRGTQTTLQELDIQ